MIPLSEINKAAKQYGVPAETIEKDYMICWLLICFSNSQLKDKFTFYGGTAIKRIYFEDHRFSEDIDLIGSGTVKHEFVLENLYRSFSTALNEANIRFEVLESELIYRNGRIQLPVSYSGYDEIIGSPKIIQLDIVMGMQVYGDINKRSIIETYSDLSDQCKVFNVQTINTIFANKIGLLMDSTRNEPRDLYDIWFFLKNKAHFDLNIPRVKAIVKQKYNVAPSSSLLLSCLKVEAYKKRWEYRLEKQMKNLPNVDVVLKEIQEQLTIIF